MTESLENTASSVSSTSLSQEFYRIMKYERELLPNFLKEHGSYDNLKIYIQEIEENKNDKNENIFSDMC